MAVQTALCLLGGTASHCECPGPELDTPIVTKKRFLLQEKRKEGRKEEKKEGRKEGRKEGGREEERKEGRKEGRPTG